MAYPLLYYPDLALLFPYLNLPGLPWTLHISHINKHKHAIGLMEKLVITVHCFLGMNFQKTVNEILSFGFLLGVDHELRVVLNPPV